MNEISCPLCGARVVVLAEVSSVRVLRPSLGDPGTLLVDFADTAVSHICSPGVLDAVPTVAVKRYGPLDDDPPDQP